MNSTVPSSSNVNDYWEKQIINGNQNNNFICKIARENLQTISDLAKENFEHHKLSFNQNTGKIVPDYDGTTRWIIGGLKNVVSSTIGYSAEWSKDITNLPSFIKFVELAISSSKKRGDESLLEEARNGLIHLAAEYRAQKNKGENADLVEKACDRLHYLKVLLNAQTNGKEVSANIYNYGIKSEDDLLNIAEAAFKQNPIETLKNILIQEGPLAKKALYFLTRAPQNFIIDNIAIDRIDNPLIPQINPDEKTILAHMVIENFSDPNTERSNLLSNKDAEDLSLIFGYLDLQTLDLSHCYRLNEESILKFIENCPNLKTLVLNDTAVTPAIQNKLAGSNCKILTSPSGKGTLNEYQKAELIEHVIYKLKYIKAMSDAANDGKFLTDNIHMYDITIYSDLKNILETAFKQNPIETLKNINKFGYMLAYDPIELLKLVPQIDPPLDDQTKQVLVQNIIESYKVPTRAISYSLSPDDGKRLASLIRNLDLKTLDLSHCHKLDELSICELIKNNPNVTTLILNDCGRQITDNVIKTITESCENLKSISVEGAPISDQAIEKLVTQLPHLNSLKLSKCGNITDLALQHIAEKCKNLTELDLSHSTKITDNYVINLINKCNQLKVIDLNYCKQLSTRVIDAVADKCHNLESLSIEDEVASRITNVSLVRVAKNCPNLTSLNIKGFKTLEVVPLNTVATSSQKLTKINLEDCDNITYNQIIEFRGKCKNPIVIRE